MADGSPGNVREKIVTLNSLQPPETEGLESAGRAGEETPASQLALARYYQIMERLRQETEEKGSNLLVTVPDRETSLVQSELARQAAADRALPAGGLEVKFGTGLAGGDWFGWMSSLLDWVDRCKAHPIVRPATTKTSVLAGRRERCARRRLGHGPVRRAEDRQPDRKDRRLRPAVTPGRRLLLGNRARRTGAVPGLVAVRRRGS